MMCRSWLPNTRDRSGGNASTRAASRSAPLGAPPHLGPQPDHRDQADPHQPDNDEHPEGLHGLPLSQCDVG